MTTFASPDAPKTRSISKQSSLELFGFRPIERSPDHVAKRWLYYTIQCVEGEVAQTAFPCILCLYIDFYRKSIRVFVHDSVCIRVSLKHVQWT